MESVNELLWVSFYKILKFLSVPLEFHYLAIVSSLHLCRSGKGRKRVPKIRLSGEGYKPVNRKKNVKMSKGGGYTKGGKGSFRL